MPTTEIEPSEIKFFHELGYDIQTSDAAEKDANSKLKKVYDVSKLVEKIFSTAGKATDTTAITGLKWFFHVQTIRDGNVAQVPFDIVADKLKTTFYKRFPRTYIIIELTANIAAELCPILIKQVNEMDVTIPSRSEFVKSMQQHILQREQLPVMQRIWNDTDPLDDLLSEPGNALFAFKQNLELIYSLAYTWKNPGKLAYNAVIPDPSVKNATKRFVENVRDFNHTLFYLNYKNLELSNFGEVDPVCPFMNTWEAGGALLYPLFLYPLGAPAATWIEPRDKNKKEISFLELVPRDDKNSPEKSDTIPAKTDKQTEAEAVKKDQMGSAEATGSGLSDGAKNSLIELAVAAQPARDSQNSSSEKKPSVLGNITPFIQGIPGGICAGVVSTENCVGVNYTVEVQLPGVAHAAEDIINELIGYKGASRKLLINGEKFEYKVDVIGGGKGRRKVSMTHAYSGHEERERCDVSDINKTGNQLLAEHFKLLYPASTELRIVIHTESGFQLPENVLPDISKHHSGKCTILGHKYKYELCDKEADYYFTYPKGRRLVVIDRDSGREFEREFFLKKPKTDHKKNKGICDAVTKELFAQAVERNFLLEKDACERKLYKATERNAFEEAKQIFEAFSNRYAPLSILNGSTYEDILKREAHYQYNKIISGTEAELKTLSIDPTFSQWTSAIIICLDSFKAQRQEKIANCSFLEELDVFLGDPIYIDHRTEICERSDFLKRSIILNASGEKLKQLSNQPEYASHTDQITLQQDQLTQQKIVANISPNDLESYREAYCQAAHIINPETRDAFLSKLADHLCSRVATYEENREVDKSREALNLILENDAGHKLACELMSQSYAREIDRLNVIYQNNYQLLSQAAEFEVSMHSQKGLSQLHEITELCKQHIAEKTTLLNKQNKYKEKIKSTSHSDTEDANVQSTDTTISDPTPGAPASNPLNFNRTSDASRGLAARGADGSARAASSGEPETLAVPGVSLEARIADPTRDNLKKAEYNLKLAYFETGHFWAKSAQGLVDIIWFFAHKKEITGKGTQLQRRMEEIKNFVSLVPQTIAQHYSCKITSLKQESGSKSSNDVMLNQARYLLLLVQLFQAGIQPYFSWATHNRTPTALELDYIFPQLENADKLLSRFMPIAQLVLSAGTTIVDPVSGLLSFSPELLLEIPAVHKFLLDPNLNDQLAKPRFIIGMFLSKLQKRNLLGRFIQQMGYASTFSDTIIAWAQWSSKCTTFSQSSIEQFFYFIRNPQMFFEEGTNAGKFVNFFVGSHNFNFTLKILEIGSALVQIDPLEWNRHCVRKLCERDNAILRRHRNQKTAYFGDDKKDILDALSVYVHDIGKHILSGVPVSNQISNLEKILNRPIILIPTDEFKNNHSLSDITIPQRQEDNLLSGNPIYIKRNKEGYYQALPLRGELYFECSYTDYLIEQTQYLTDVSQRHIIPVTYQLAKKGVGFCTVLTKLSFNATVIVSYFLLQISWLIAKGIFSGSRYLNKNLQPLPTSIVLMKLLFNAVLAITYGMWCVFSTIMSGLLENTIQRKKIIYEGIADSLIQQNIFAKEVKNDGESVLKTLGILEKM